MKTEAVPATFVFGRFGKKDIMSRAIIERRRNPRVAVPVCAWLQQRETAVFSTTAADVSAGGARFFAVRPKKQGDAILVFLQLKTNESPLECKGRICWCERGPNGLYAYGVRFVDLSACEQAQIAEFVAEVQARATLTAV